MDNQHRQIKGYNELDQTTIDSINDVKLKANEVKAMIDDLNKKLEMDTRWLQLAEDDIQTGFMKLIRSITKPGSY